MAKLIVGLGNPGPQYSRTRHNVGFMVIDKLVAVNSSSSTWRHVDSALIKRGKISGTDIIFAKPQTYMNASGVSVARLVNRFCISLDEILVVYDDLNLDLGRLRLRRKGSAGGHNGMKSLIHCIGTEEFARLRIGIGSPQGENVVDYVLGKFSFEEKTVIDEALTKAAKAVVIWVESGIDIAMSAFNG